MPIYVFQTGDTYHAAPRRAGRAPRRVDRGEKRAYVLADNQLGDYRGGWGPELCLRLELGELKSAGLIYRDRVRRLELKDIMRRP